MDPEFWDEINFKGDSDQEIAKRVADNRNENIKQVLTLHGEKSQTKKRLNTYANSFDDNTELYSKAGTTITIDGLMNHSYCLDGLNRNTVVFKSKIKHVMVRNCDDTRIYLNGGTIAGIDVLFGSNVSIRTPKHNFTNVEESSHTILGGDIDRDSLIHVTKSLDVFVNHRNLNVNPFSDKPLKMVYKTDKTTDRLDIGEMSISPVADSCNERWANKLMMMAQKHDNDDNDDDKDKDDESY